MGAMRRMTCLLLACAAFAQDVSLAEADKKMRARDYEGALADYDKAIAEAPEDPRGHAGRAGALNALGKNDDALASITRAIELRPEGRFYYVRGLIQLARDDEAAAVADFTKGIEVAPQMGVLHRARGDVRYRQHDYAGAATDYQRAVEIDADDLTAVERLGQTKESLRDFEGALASYTRLVEAASHHPRPFQMRGNAKLLLGDYKGAVDDFDAAIFNDEKDGHSYVSRARAKLALGKKEDADADATKSVEADEGARTYAERGRYWFDTGRTKEAAADLAKAVEKDPEDQDYTRLFLFLARAKAGERDAAAAQLKAYADGRAKKDDWYGRIVAFLTGQMKEEAFLAAAKAENAHVAREQECEACWYAGAARLLAGDGAGAKPLLDRCIATDIRNFIEYGSAQAALAAMPK
jgi:tetratricopeptide (TPR) repeat protein